MFSSHGTLISGSPHLSLKKNQGGSRSFKEFFKDKFKEFARALSGTVSTIFQVPGCFREFLGVFRDAGHPTLNR